MKKLSYRPQAGSISMGRNGRVDLQNAPSRAKGGGAAPGTEHDTPCVGDGTRSHRRLAKGERGDADGGAA